jgi:hypothetical protein
MKRLAAHKIGMRQKYLLREGPVKRLCGLILFAVGFGMALILIFPKNFFWVCTAIGCLIVGYNMFCS